MFFSNVATSVLAFAFHANLGDLELAHMPAMICGCCGYTYMAGDTKLSPREMLAAGGS